VRLGVALRSKGLMIVVTIEMSPRPRNDIIGSNDGKRPSQPNERMRNVLDATQALEAMVSRLMEALVNVRGERTPSGGKGCSFKEFYKHPFPMFQGKLNSDETRKWLTNLEELLQVMDYIDEERIKYTAYMFSGEARRWWYAKRSSLVMELGSEEDITWSRLKESSIGNTCEASKGVHPESCILARNRVVGAIGVADCILGMQIKEEFVLLLCQGGTLHSEL
jgi:hypothetical protein